jgi:hypothetical protein
MKISHFLLAMSVMTGTILPITLAAQAHHGPHPVFNVTPYGSSPVSGVVGSGATPNNLSGVIFGNGKQQQVNTVGASLSAASITGQQTVNGKTVNVPADAAQIAIDVINAKSGTEIPAVANLTIALGGGAVAQQLAESLQGLRGSDGSISPIVLSQAVNAYNDYLKVLAKDAKVTGKPLASVVESLPAGQKAVQVILGKLVAAAN